MRLLDEAKLWWQKTIYNDGGDCPCCGRWGKVYPRSINVTMAKSLVWLGDHSSWVDVPNTAPRWVLRSNQLPTLRWWGLVERMENSPDSDQKHSGVWRVTSRGRDFLSGYYAVPKKVFTYDGWPVKWSEEEVFLDDCLEGGSFLYNSVMEKAQELSI